MRGFASGMNTPKDVTGRRTMRKYLLKFFSTVTLGLMENVERQREDEETGGEVA